MRNKSLNYIQNNSILFFQVWKKYRNKNAKFVQTKNERKMFLSKCAVCDNEKSKFIKQREAKELLGKLTGIKVPILDDLAIANISF